MITFDFETEAIIGNPIANPPKPVGVAIKTDDQPAKYWAWGHPTGNNCTWEEGRRALSIALINDTQWLAHNAAFEAAVLRSSWGFCDAIPPIDFHDTQYLVFLHDPYAFSFGLKPSAERILGVPPDEQDELKAWILANVPEARASDWGAHISKAPGDLVGRYACGDVDRTYALYKHLMPQIEAKGMLGAYQREQRLMPILSESSRRGVRVDLPKLGDAIEKYTAAKKAAEEGIYRALGEFNLDSDRELAERLELAGQVTEWVYTPTGKRSTSRKNLVGRVRNPELLEALAYRGVLATCLGTFAEPWLASASANNGRLHPQWNQVRGDRGTGGDTTGARTGRMSCRDPNLQNIPNDFENLKVPEGLPPVIHMREFLLPEEGHVWVKRDFSAQEMRILAHYAEGRLFEAFREKPTTDPHVEVQAIILNATGMEIGRKGAKGISFAKIYGQGREATAAQLKISAEAVVRFQEAYDKALPEIPRLIRDIKYSAKRGEPIRTWGGRLYHTEPHPNWDLSYKLINYLCQGSAADQTKQSIIDWHGAKHANDQLIAAVHDEINISVPEERLADGMKTLREQMDADRFDVPFRSEGFVGPNWSEIERYE